MPVAAQQQASTTAPRTYAINAGDEIEIYVWGEERLQRTIRVLPDGSFSFPLVGRVEALGKSTAQIEAAITQGLSSQYRGQVPQVTVSVSNPAGLQFSIAGKVRNPGSFAPGRYVNVLEAISLAGGPTEFANMDNVVIIRKQGNALAQFRVHLAGAMKGNLSSDALSAGAIPQVESGDTVIVP